MIFPVELHFYCVFSLSLLVLPSAHHLIAYSLCSRCPDLSCSVLLQWHFLPFKARAGNYSGRHIFGHNSPDMPYLFPNKIFCFSHLRNFKSNAFSRFVLLRLEFVFFVSLLRMRSFPCTFIFTSVEIASSPDARHEEAKCKNDNNACAGIMWQR